MGAIVCKSDFESLLAAPLQSRSAHFAVHHVRRGVAAPGRAADTETATDLSTGLAPIVPNAVDIAPGGCWLGTLVPKRHARRSVTRNLLRRQIRAAVVRHADALPEGLWLVRLKAPFASALFRSAASDLLRRAAREELDSLLARAASTA